MTLATMDREWRDRLRGSGPRLFDRQMLGRRYSLVDPGSVQGTIISSSPALYVPMDRKWSTNLEVQGRGLL